jgi:nicotinamidase-related amidase
MNADDLPRSSELLSAGCSRLLVIDVQERLAPHIREGEAVIANCRRLASGAAELGVPVSATEQYPQGLGPTVAALRGLIGPPVEKLRFSAAGSLEWCGTGGRTDAGAADAADAGAADDRDQVVLAGLESHVCVLQTAFDLLALGFRVFVPADAVGSRRELDRQTALNRLRDGGAVVTTTESVLFEWCETAANPQFKAISRLVK